MSGRRTRPRVEPPDSSAAPTAPTTPAAEAPAKAPAAAASSNGKAVAARPTTVRTLLENVECLAIAIVMALILKYFLIEAYKIPTGSMQPTIIGDAQAGIFDRVLVNKMVYFLRSPRRYEVVVFRMPLVQRQNYIKRLIGLPGETVRIRNGDIFITPPDGAGQAIARKPDAVWRSVRKQILPGTHEERPLDKMFSERSGRSVIRKDTVVLQATADTEASVVLRKGVKDRYFDGYEKEWVTSSQSSSKDRFVSDLELTAQVVPSSGARTVTFEIQESHFRHLAEFDLTRGSLRVSTRDRNSGEPVLDTAAEVTDLDLEMGESFEASFRNVDDELVVELGGDQILRRPYVTAGIDAPQQTALVAVSATDGEVTLEDVHLYRDIYYTPTGTDDSPEALYKVPEHHYFVMGDNTQNSHDCRQWQLLTITDEDGRVIEGHDFDVLGNADANPRLIGGDQMVFTNIYGQTYTLPLGLDKDSEPFRWVPEEFMLGKAMAVFWPIPPFAPSWRLKWVR